MRSNTAAATLLITFTLISRKGISLLLRVISNCGNIFPWRNKRHYSANRRRHAAERAQSIIEFAEKLLRLKRKQFLLRHCAWLALLLLFANFFSCSKLVIELGLQDGNKWKINRFPISIDLSSIIFRMARSHLRKALQNIAAMQFPNRVIFSLVPIMMD